MGPQTASQQEKIEFVSSLGAALHRYGTPAHRLEAALSSVSERLGLSAQFMSMPTAVLAAFRVGPHEEGRLMRIGPGETNLEKLSQIDAAGDRVLSGELTLAEGLAHIEAITKSPPLYPVLLKALCTGLSSGAMAVFLRGRLAEVLAAGVIGTVIGLMELIPSAAFKRVSEAAAAFLATMLALAFAKWIDPRISVQSTTLASLLILMPGLSFTVGMAEVATQNLVAGTARLTGAGMVLLKLIFGVVLATQVFEMLFHALPPDSPSIRAGATWLKELGALLVVAGTLGVNFNVRMKDWGWILVAIGISFYSTQLAGRGLGPELGVFVGGLCIGAASNAFARLKNRPATLLMVPGILLLVPGSLGYRSLAFFSENNVLSGVEAAFKMAFIASAIVAGLFFGNSLVAPRRSL